MRRNERTHQRCSILNNWRRSPAVQTNPATRPEKEQCNEQEQSTYPRVLDPPGVRGHTRAISKRGTPLRPRRSTRGARSVACGRHHRLCRRAHRGRRERVLRRTRTRHPLLVRTRRRPPRIARPIVVDSGKRADSRSIRTRWQVHGDVCNRCEPESVHCVFHIAHPRVGGRGSTHPSSHGATGGGGTVRRPGSGVACAHPGQVGNRGGIVATTGTALARAEPDRRTTRHQLDPRSVGVLNMTPIHHENVEFDLEDDTLTIRLGDPNLNVVVRYLQSDGSDMDEYRLYRLDWKDDQWLVHVNTPLLNKKIETAIELYSEDLGADKAKQVSLEDLLFCTVSDICELLEAVEAHQREEHP